jgi:archaellum biogenesis ATPase FlaH
MTKIKGKHRPWSLDDDEKKKAKPKGITLKDLKMQFNYNSDIKYIWRNTIPKGMPTLLSGREGSGKSTNCLQISKEILKDNHRGFVVWLATEGAVLDTVDKMEKMGVGDKRFVVAQKSDLSFKFDFSRHSDRDELSTLLNELSGPILAVFIDSVRGMSKYKDSDDEIGRIMNNLNAIVCDNHKAALIYIDHHKKGDAKNLNDKLSGTPAKSAAVRIHLGIEKKSKLVRTIKPAKINIFAEIPEFESIQVGNNIHIRELTDLNEGTQKDQAQIWLTDLLSKNKEIFATDIYEMGKEKGFSDSLIRKAKADLPIDMIQTGNRSKWIWLI